MRILAFGHRKRNGKTQSARFAIAYLRLTRPDLKVYTLGFADSIKAIAYKLFSWGGLQTGIYYENNASEIEVALPAIGKSPRQLWDAIGLDGRNLCESVWYELGTRYIPNADIVIFSDNRAVFESNKIIESGGVCVKINRPNMPRGGPVDDLLNDFTGWYRIIENDGTLKELNDKVKLLCDDLLKEWKL